MAECDEQPNGCTWCHNRLSVIEEKRDKLLVILPEFEHLKTRVATLEEAKESMLESLKFTQKEVKELQTKVKSTVASLEAANKELVKLSELEHRTFKEECYNRRNNIKFFGIKDSDKESTKDNEETLRLFLKERNEDSARRCRPNPV